jgi:hypothetical protein
MELDYCCCCETGIKELVSLVHKMITKGWEPQGGVAIEVLQNPGYQSLTLYYQAMIRREPK